MKFEPDSKRKGVNWLGVGTEAAMIVLRGANFTLRQMVNRTAGRLNVAESSVEIHFGRSAAGHWGWTASVRIKDTIHRGQRLGDPMHALAALVEMVEQNT